MRIHSLSISSYRGIKQLLWKPRSSLTCLIGPGDSCKTTILDAISVVMSPRNSISFSDADFYNGNTQEPIVIEVVITDLDKEIISLDALGSHVCGVTKDGILNTDPQDGDIKALAIRLTVDETLEPSWEVYKPNDDNVQPKYLTASMRIKFGVFRVDERSDTHLRWTRGSALSAITNGADRALPTTVEAQRSARAAVFQIENDNLYQAASEAKKASNTFGAKIYDKLQVGLDPEALNTGHSLVLHNGLIPLTREGLGTKRLVSLGIQEASKVGANIILIDEIESSLEPHRLHHLLHTLLKRSGEDNVQIIFTSHSPLVVERLGSEGLAITRTDRGESTVRYIPKEVASLDQGALQKMIRSGPSAMLAKRVVVVEGATEMGMIRALTETWDDARVQEGQPPLAAIGTAVRNGSSDKEALKRAQALASLGYEVLSLIDSDNPLRSEESAAQEAGVISLRWGDGLCLESRILRDLPLKAISKIVDMAITFKLEDVDNIDTATTAIFESIYSQLPREHEINKSYGIDLEKWSSVLSEDIIKDTIARVAVKKGWFKDEQRGYRLGGLLLDERESLTSTPTSLILGRLKRFVYDR